MKLGSMRVYLLTTHLVKIIPKVKEMTLTVDDTWLTIRKVVVKYFLKIQEIYIEEQIEERKKEKNLLRDTEREELQTMIYTECLICQNSWTFLTMIKKTLGKINNTFPFHHIWILLLLKENDFSWIHSWFVLFRIILAAILWYFILGFFCSLEEKNGLLHFIYGFTF